MTETLRRPDLFVPLSVRFATGSTGTAIQDKFGLEGLAVWAAFLAACKLNRPEGEISYASEAEGWSILGVAKPPAFTLNDFFAFTGRLKKTRRTRSGQVTYTVCTPWERWSKEQRQEAERRRKARLREQSKRDTERISTGTAAGQKPDLEVEVEVEVEPPHTPPQTRGGNGDYIPKKELRRYTGCRRTRGTHGLGWKHDPLGTDPPPPDWPHDKPTLEEVLAARARTQPVTAPADDDEPF
jgi:hypothetical protein